MKILYLSPVGALGGAERCLLDLMASVRAAHPEVSMHLLAGGDGPLVSSAEQLGVDVAVRPMPVRIGALGDSGLKDGGRSRAAAHLARAGLRSAMDLSRYVRSTRREIARIRPTLVHSNGIKFHLLSAFTVPRDVPVVWHVRDFIGSRPMVTRLLRLASGRAACAVAISKAVDRDIRSSLPGLPVELVYDAIDTDCFSPGPPARPLLDEASGLGEAPAGTLKVGLVATYARWKGQDLFIDAIGRIAAERATPPMRFYIVGGPIYHTAGSQFSIEELRRLVEERGLGDRIGFVPFREEIHEVYRELDVVVHASTEPEPFGRTIAEALACGRPLVLSRESGAAELFDRGGDAVTFRRGDPDDLARAIADLAGDEGKRRDLGRHARRLAVEKYARQRLGRDVLELYERLLAGAKHRPLAIAESAL